MFRGYTFMEAAETPVEEDQPLDLMNTDVELDDPEEGRMSINDINIEDDITGYEGDEDLGDEEAETTSYPGLEDSDVEPISGPVDDRPIVHATQIDIMGADNSDIHNEFDRKDVDVLNTLIASEQSAIGEYFTAAKDTNDELLRRLYSDIGDEERFHSEQLIFAKSRLTGEKYVPRDPNVKKEYEELMAMGMDEETAMATAVDKVGLMPKEGMAIVDPVAEVEECVRIQHDVDDIESSLYQEAVLEMIMMSPAVTSLVERDNAVGVLLEAYMADERNAEVYLEAVENISDMPKKQVKTIENPFKVILRWIGKLLSLIKTLGHKVAIWATKMRNRRKEKSAWIKRHGISGLFKSGVGLYFWNDNPSKGPVGFNVFPIIQYNHFLMNMMKAIARQWNIGLDATPPLIFDKQVRDIPFNSIDDAVERLNGINLYKTKLIVTEANQPVILEQIFGYYEEKVKYTKTDSTTGEETNKSESANVYNVFQALSTDLSKYLDIAKSLATHLDQMTSTNTAAQNNPEQFKKAVNAVQKIIKAFNMLITALTSDMNQCMKLNNEITSSTQTMDEYDEKHGAGSYGNTHLKPLYEKYKKAADTLKTARDLRARNRITDEALQRAQDAFNEAAKEYQDAKQNPKERLEGTDKK